MTKEEAVLAYLEQRAKFVPEHLRSVFALFSENITVLIVQQKVVRPDTILRACFLPPEDSKFRDLVNDFHDDRTMSREDFRDILGRIYENQNLLYDSEQTYRTRVRGLVF